MAMWHLMLGFGLGLIATIITVIGSRQAIQNRPNCSKKQEYISPPDDVCAVCQEKMSNNEISYLICGHGFHDKCLRELKRNKWRQCPICRHNI